MLLKTVAAIFLAAMLPLAAQAVNYSRVDTVRVGNKIVTTGDPISKIADDQTQPDSKTDLINDFGVKKGEEWIYIRSGGHSATVIRINNDGTVTGVLDMLGL